MHKASILLVVLLDVALALEGATECQGGVSCASGTVGQALLQSTKTVVGKGGKGRLGKMSKKKGGGHVDDDGWWNPGEDYGGDEDEVKEPDWVKNVPEGMNKVENWDKDDCQKKCIKLNWDKLEGANAGKGYCDYCGIGNACCKWNDPLTENITECSGVDKAPYEDEWGFMSNTMRCVYPKASNISNYEKFKQEAWEAAMKLLTGANISPEKMSQYAAPEVDQEDGYQKFTGKGKPAYYLGVAGEEDQTLQAECPALNNSKYGLSNGGLFDGMTYHKYPYWTASGMELQIKVFCGARYTDDPSEETQKAALLMATTACNDMGEKCGGLSVGADDECCGNKGCTEVVFLAPGASAAFGAESDVIDPAPLSFKSGKYQLNYITFIKK